MLILGLGLGLEAMDLALALVLMVLALFASLAQLKKKVLTSAYGSRKSITLQLLSECLQ